MQPLQAVAGHEVEVPLFASSTSSPFRRGVRKTEQQPDNQQCYVGSAVKSDVTTVSPNQTSSASNIKPSVIKVEVSDVPCFSKFSLSSIYLKL